MIGKVGVSLKNSGKSLTILLLLIFIGLLLGSFCGEILASYVPALKFLKTSYMIGFGDPINLDGKVFMITFGFKLYINLLSVIGVIIAIVLYRKY